MLLYMGRGAALAAYRREQRVRDLTECADACGRTVRGCLERLVAGPDDRTRDHLALALVSARDCLELCTLTASLMARESTLSRSALPACEEACRRCAESCDALSSDDGAADCASLCRRAEGVCRRSLDS